jgi:hypothetical protein
MNLRYDGVSCRGWESSLYSYSQGEVRCCQRISLCLALKDQDLAAVELAEVRTFPAIARDRGD